MNIIDSFKILIFTSVIVSTILAGYVYNKGGNSQSLRYLSGLLFANVVYATSYFFEITATSLDQIKFFLNMEYLGIFFIPIFWVFIAWSYHPGKSSYNQNLLRNLRFLYFIPIIVNLFVWTNEWHHLIYYNIGINYNLSISLIDVERAPGFWVINSIIILLYLVATFRMVYNFIRSKGNQRKQYLLLSLAAVPPFLSYILILKQATPYSIDLNPIAFALSGLILFWGIGNLQLFNILPIAQKLVIDVMRDAMIVLDTKGCLLECNLPAQLMFVNDTQTLFKVPLSQLNPHLSPLFSHSSDTYEIEIVLPETEEIKTFSVHRVLISDRHNRTRGNLYLLHDITDIGKYVKELELLASFDGLTNLLNHRQFMNLANKEAHRLQKQGSGKFSLIMFDLDNFKAINDAFGHSAGDNVLQQIGQIVPQQVHSYDLCARYGGEEFVILLYDTAIIEATALAEKIRSVIEQTNFTFHDTELQITASFGVSTYSPQYKNSWEITLNQADTALYQAKDAGRNVVIPFQVPDSL